MSDTQHCSVSIELQIRRDPAYRQRCNTSWAKYQRDTGGIGVREGGIPRGQCEVGGSTDIGANADRVGGLTKTECDMSLRQRSDRRKG